MSTSKNSSGDAKLSDVNLTDPDFVDKEKKALIEENHNLKKKARQNMVLALGLGVIALIALGVLVGLAVNRSIDDDTPANLGKKGPLVCGSTPEGFTRSSDRLDEPTHPGLFHGLTTTEIRRVRAFLEMDIGVVKPDVATLRDPHIYIMDLQPPIKSEALAHLDHGDVQPDRQARVTVFRGDKTPPVVEEMVCGPLHNISACTVDLTVPFAHRPIEYREYIIWDRTIIREIQRLFGQILRESYGGSFDYDTCEDDCLNYWSVPIGSNVYGDLNTRKVWLWFTYHLDFMILHPLDFAVLCNVDGTNETLFSIENVWYAGQMFENAAQLLNAYAAGSINKIRTTYPTEEEITWARLQQQDPPKPSQPLRPPQLIEPDGKRFTVTHGKVEYLDMWSFHYHMSTVHGPALYDIRFQGERIVYELALMELVALYSGDNPAARLTFYADSSAVTGSQSKVLIPNADCPSTATFLPFIVSSQDKEDPDVFSKGICIFEQNMGRPLRRHHSYSTDDGSFYGGMMNSVLIIRSIHTVDNYDYILDFKFHQDGAIHVSMSSTGYIMASVYSSAEKLYGNRIRENLFGPLHLHAGHFKVDMDINGTSNRYETLNIESEEVDLRQTSPVRKFFQTKFTHDLKSREMDAAYIYEFDKPMYHIFHNDEARNVYGERKSYRLVNNAMAKQMIPRDEGNERSFTWTRYQMSVTERKDTERVSSTPDTQWNSVDPVVNFQTYIDDNDDIVDKDLVAWVTLSSHHIPHTEDLPVTPTTGTELSFFLQPYNYFLVNPYVTSRDAVYIDHVDDDNPSLGLTFDYLGTGDVTMEQTWGKCEFQPVNISAAMSPNELFD